MTESINIYDAKTQFSRLLDRVAEGQEVVISRHGRPVARLVPYRAPRADRMLGAFAGQVHVAPDFDATPADVLDAFEGESPS